MLHYELSFWGFRPMALEKQLQEHHCSSAEVPFPVFKVFLFFQIPNIL